MISFATLFVVVLHVAFHNILQSQAIPSTSWGVVIAANIIGRNVVDDGDDDNGHNVSHNVLQAIIVVLGTS